MAVRRIVADLAAARPAEAVAFYGGVLGLRVAMDLGWVVTFEAEGASAAPQVSVLSEGGSGAPVPDLSVEVDDLDAVLARARAAGLAVEYGPAAEPWGVRRFFVRDPCGRLVNVLAHDGGP